MADSESSLIAINARRSSFPSTSGCIPLNMNSKHSQPAGAQVLTLKTTELTNGIFTTTHSGINLHNPNPSNDTTLISTSTRDGIKPPLLHNFDLMNTPFLHSQVLVPNPLLSCSVKDAYMSIDQHFRETKDVSSPTAWDARPILDENLVTCLSSPLHQPLHERTSFSNAGVPGNDSLLGLNGLSFSIVQANRHLLEAHTSQIPFLSADKPPAGRNIIPKRDLPVAYNASNGASDQHRYAIAQSGFHSPRFTNGNESFRNEDKIRPLCSEKSLTNKVRNSSDFQLENIQITPLHIQGSIHSSGIVEKDDYCALVSPSIPERYHCALQAHSDPASHETTVFDGQGDVSGLVIDSHSTRQLSTQKYTGGYRAITQTGKLLEQHGKVQDSDFGIYLSAQNDVTEPRQNDSPGLVQDHLLENSLLGQQQTKENCCRVEIMQPPGKRRKQHCSQEQQIEYEEYETVDQTVEPICTPINSRCNMILLEGEESSHHFTKQEDAHISPEYRRFDLDDCGLSDHIDATREYNDNAREEKQTADLETEKSSAFDQNHVEMQNEEREKELETLEEHEPVSERNGTVGNQQEFIGKGENEISSPSHILRAVEQKEGCMFMVLEVHEPAVCESCGKRFPTLELLDLHIGKKHNTSTRRRYRKRKRQPKEYQCTVCNLHLANDANLRRHYKIVHEGETVETCSICDANFNSHHGLVLHMRDLHGITPDSVQEKEGRNRRKRQYRRKKATTADQKRAWVVWKCGKCSFFSQNKGNMTRHINIVHLKIADHLCQECSEVFKTKHNLQVHLMNRHPKHEECTEK